MQRRQRIALVVVGGLVAVALAALLVSALADGDDDDEAATTTSSSSSSTTTTLPTTTPTTTSTSTSTTSTSTSTTTTSTTTPASTTTTTTAPAPPFDGGTSPTSAPPPPGSTEVALLTAVRVAGQGPVDRIVFEFRDDSLPGFDVGFTEAPTASGSGDPVEVEGEAFLAVRMEPASGVDLSSTGEPTYDGPDRVTGDTGVVTEVVRTGDFEANLEWVIGLDVERAYRVDVLEGPARLVIEVDAS